MAKKIKFLAPIIFLAASVFPCYAAEQTMPQKDAQKTVPVKVKATPAAICTRPLPLFGAAFAIDSDMRVDYDFGIPVIFVQSDTPAASAGLLAGDILLSVDGQKIFFAKQFFALLCTYKPNDSVTIEFIHDGKKMTKQIKLAERGGNTVKQGKSNPNYLPGEEEKDDIRLIINGREILLTQDSAWLNRISLTPDAVIIRTSSGIPEDLHRIVERVRRRVPTPNQLATSFRMDIHGTRAEVFKHLHSTFEQVFFGNGYSVIISGENGKRSVTVRDKENEIFRGPCNTQEEIDAIPKDIQKIISEFTQLHPNPNLKIESTPPSKEK